MAYTFSNLKTDIRSYTEVDSTVLSDSLLTTIAKNSENKIYRAADNDDNRFYATSTLTIGNRYVTIPSDLRIIRYAQLEDSAGNQTYLLKRDPTFMAEYYDKQGTAGGQTGSPFTGLPKYYGNWDETYWVVAPTPDTAYSITLAYVKQPTTITTSDSTTTYLSNKYQDLLLYGCLVNTYGYLKGPVDMIQYYEQAFQQALQTYAIEQQGRRRRDEYQDGVIRTPIKSAPPSKY